MEIEAKNGLELVRIYKGLKKGVEKLEEENEYGVHDEDIEFLKAKVEEIGNRRMVKTND